MIECYSYKQCTEMGPVPPRVPDRADAQVPHKEARGKLLYGRIAHFYFYEKGSQDDAAFGLVDIEISAQYNGKGRLVLEVYSLGDGYQSCRGIGRMSPMIIELHGPAGILVSTEWHFSDILCGHSDPLTLCDELELSEEKFKTIERVVLPPVSGSADPCG